MKATTVESKFPLLAVEAGCIISKDADITVAYRVELPELFTVTSAEYEAIHAAWVKAVKVCLITALCIRPTGLLAKNTGRRQATGI